MGKSALQVFTLSESVEWDNIVRTFKDYDVYYLSGYVKAFYLHGDGEPLLFYYNDAKTRGINVVMKRKISEDPRFRGLLQDKEYYDFATPYGYGGWLTEGEDREQLFTDYERWCRKNNIISEFVRFHPVTDNGLGLGQYYDVIPLGETVALDLTSPETIWENISSKNRNVIRKALKNDVRVYNGRFPEIFSQFIEIYNATMAKDDAEEYYYFGKEFYDSVMEDLPEQAQVFYAVIPDGTVIAASIMLDCNGRLNYHLSGSRREYSSLAATNLILYKAALWGSAHGLKTFHLGGGVGSGEDTLFKFKRSFYKGDLRRFRIGRKIYLPEIYQELTELRGDSIENRNYFPIYRG